MRKMEGNVVRPRHLELRKEEGLVVYWEDGKVSEYSIGYLRRMSPSAEARELRDEQARNPLAVLPGGSGGGGGGKLFAVRAELVGNYALRIVFSDGHRTGLYSWKYLRELDPGGFDGGDGGG
jgi:DUF971 family protein